IGLCDGRPRITESGACPLRAPPALAAGRAHVVTVLCHVRNVRPHACTFTPRLETNQPLPRYRLNSGVAGLHCLPPLLRNQDHGTSLTSMVGTMS
ncbi:MAG: hypothetical protein U0361_20420, partial [Nitrospiraceae bacterium]